MDYLALIKRPIEGDFEAFVEKFNRAMSHPDGLLSQALMHIRQRAGKQMRPMLTLLSARTFGGVSETTLDAAVALELLHTASLVHDDVVDESLERRGQASVNACYNNKVAVLVGDYVLSTCLLYVAYTRNNRILHYLSELGRSLAAGEILQLQNINNQDISEEVYFQVIRQKTASLFEACAGIGALSAGATDEQVQKAKQFGEYLGTIFQIRDDIFDYFDSSAIGKPTGNDMAEGKLTLPVIYALTHAPYESMLTLARKVKAGTINADEIAVLIEFTKQQGGIEYAEAKMDELARQAQAYIDKYVVKPDVREALSAYLEFVIRRHN